MRWPCRPRCPAAVDQEIREARREDDRLLVLAVVARTERRPCPGRARAGAPSTMGATLALGVAHRRWRVAVERAEVAATVHQRRAHAEVLRHAGERVVDRAVAVRVVLAHHVADDARALGVAPLRTQRELAQHRVEDAALDGLEAVADVGERARRDDAQRVAQVSLAGLLREGGVLELHRRWSSGERALGRTGTTLVGHGLGASEEIRAARICLVVAPRFSRLRPRGHLDRCSARGIRRLIAGVSPVTQENGGPSAFSAGQRRSGGGCDAAPRISRRWRPGDAARGAPGAETRGRSRGR